MKIITIFPKDSEALFNKNSMRTFGGADVQMYLLTKTLGQIKGNECLSFIIDYDSIDFNEQKYFNLVKTYKESDGTFKKFFIYHKKINEIKPDIIIQRGLTIFSCLLSLYCRARKIGFIFMFAHDIESLGKYQKNRKRCPLFPLLIHTAFLLIPQNKIEYDNLSGRVNPRKIKIIKKGIDTARQNNIAEKKFDLIWIARCEKWKNPGLFLDIAFHFTDLNFIMICSPVKGNEDFFNSIKDRAGRYSNIVFMEFVENDKIIEFLLQSRLFCITSDMEGDWPMVVLEAAAAKVPVVSYKLNYGGLVDLYHGGIFCNGDITYMLRSIKNIINDQELYKNMSDGIFQYLIDNHNIRKNVEDLLKAINDYRQSRRFSKQ